MPARVNRNPGSQRYFAKFTFAAVGLVAATLVLVLVVLPERYILSSGFAESGRSFPTARVPFSPLSGEQVEAQREPISFAGPALPAELFPTEAPPPAPGPAVVVRGPAEVLWDRVIPLRTNGRHGEAIPIFTSYLSAHPDDRDVRREYARTLIAAGQREQAVPVMQALLDASDEPALRLELARALRDLRRMDEANDQYARLSAASPSDTTLSLEWARANVWFERYPTAEKVLVDALERAPKSVSLRGQLAHVYYYTGRLRDAEGILAGMSRAELASADAVTLLRDVRTALTPGPSTFVPTPPTLLERALAAREARDTTGARDLFRAALRENPRDAATWLAYANFLEYELAAFDEARSALIEVDRLQGLDTPLRLRVALLEAWTGRSEQAMARLDSLRAIVAAAPPTPRADTGVVVSTAEIVALMGDLSRWNGDWQQAERHYGNALREDSANQRAIDGRRVMRNDIARLIDNVEAPRASVHAYLLGDSDDFERFDVTGAWTGIRDYWVWNIEAGQRRLSGRDLSAALDDLNGAYVDFNPARWWRFATIRTTMHAGLQRVRGGETDVSYGGGVRWRSVSGASFNAEVRHEPAYQQAPTLQSVLADLEQTRITASYDLPLGQRWSIALQADGARLEPAALAGTEATSRLSGALSLNRTMSTSWSLGISSSALAYSDASPVSGGLPLYWDPALVVTASPYVRVQGALARRWEAFLRASPGIALIDERGLGAEGRDLRSVPQFAGEVGVQYSSALFRAAFDVFYGQARVDGYRTYGARISLSRASFLSSRPQR